MLRMCTNLFAFIRLVISYHTAILNVSTKLKFIQIESIQEQCYKTPNWYFGCRMCFAALRCKI